MRNFQVHFLFAPHSPTGPLILRAKVVGDEQTLRLAAFENEDALRLAFHEQGIRPNFIAGPDQYFPYEVTEDQLRKLGLTRMGRDPVAEEPTIGTMKPMSAVDYYSTRRIVEELKRRSARVGIELLMDEELTQELERRNLEIKEADALLAQADEDRDVKPAEISLVAMTH